MRTIGTGKRGHGAATAMLCTVVLACGTPAEPDPQVEPTPDPFPPDLADEVAWLQANAAPIATLETGSGDFSDLEALGDAIGSARVVLLGEQSHGDGTVFLTKARLIEYLHSELGFDVLAFESGLYDLDRAWRMIEDGEPVPDAIRRGVFPIWTESREFQPTIEYVEDQAGTASPLELAGFDVQFTGSASIDFLAAELDSLLQAHGSDLPDDGAWSAFLGRLQDVVEGLWRSEPPSDGDREAFESMLTDARVEIAALADQDAPGTALWLNVLDGAADEADRAIRFATVGTTTWEMVEQRDIGMARNLVWLANERFPDRKVIVWAATFHIVRDIQQIDPLGANVEYEDLVTMGKLVGDALGDDAYVLGFTAYRGVFGAWSSSQESLLSAPEDRNLEGLLNEAGLTNAFVDFRSRDAAGDWLDRLQIARPLGYTDMRARWPDQMDGIVFNRTMNRSTPR